MVLGSCEGAVFTFPAVRVQPWARTVIIQVGPCDGVAGGVAGLGVSESSRKEPHARENGQGHPPPPSL